MGKVYSPVGFVRGSSTLCLDPDRGWTEGSSEIPRAPVDPFENSTQNHRPCPVRGVGFVSSTPDPPSSDGILLP